MLSKIVANITPSATCELEGTVADLKAAGVDVIGLNAGEPDQICVSTGAKQALNNAVLAVVDPGDEVIIPMPGWVSYIEIVKLYGGIPVCVDTKPDFQLDIDAIAKAITPKTAAIIINTPNNPTGAVYDRESLEALAKLAIENDFYIISDEVYEKLVYDGAKHECIASFSKEAYDRTIVINGMSKAYAMTGWRIGYSAAPADIAHGLKDIQGHTTSNGVTFIQWASIEALQNCEDEIKRMVVEYKKRKDYACDRLAKIEGVVCKNVNGAFYLLPDVSCFFGKKAGGKEIKDSFDFCNYILDEAHVAIVPGGAFNAPNCVRIAYTNSLDKIAEAFDRMEKAIAKIE